MDNKIPFRIKRILEEKGLYQNAAARRAGFTAQQFNDMVNGKRIIRAEYIQPIADALGVSVADLLELQEPPT